MGGAGGADRPEGAGQTNKHPADQSPPQKNHCRVRVLSTAGEVSAGILTSGSIPARLSAQGVTALFKGFCGVAKLARLVLEA